MFCTVALRCWLLALLAIPSSRFILCRRRILLTNLEKVERVTRVVEVGAPAALVPLEGRWP